MFLRKGRPQREGPSVREFRVPVPLHRHKAVTTRDGVRSYASCERIPNPAHCRVRAGFFTFNRWGRRERS